MLESAPPSPPARYSDSRDDTELLRPSPGTQNDAESAAVAGDAGFFQPLREPSPFLAVDERFAAGFPALNYRPFILQDKVLKLSIAWFFLTASGTSCIVAFSQIQYSWFHFRTTTAYNFWAYSPGVTAFLTLLLWRSIRQSFDDVLPFVEMANLSAPTSSDTAGPQGQLGRRSTMPIPLTSQPPNNVSPTIAFQLLRDKNWPPLAVSVGTLLSIVLVLIKPNLLQTVQDPNGWKVVVSFGVGVTAAIICFVLCLDTLFIYWFLKRYKTGLKWSPASLAAKIALMQGSNILHTLSGTKFGRLKGLDKLFLGWHDKYGVPRLGYWRTTGRQSIIHGVRLITPPERTMRPGQSLSAAPMEREGRNTPAPATEASAATATLLTEGFPVAAQPRNSVGTREVTIRLENSQDHRRPPLRSIPGTPARCPNSIQPSWWSRAWQFLTVKKSPAVVVTAAAADGHAEEDELDAKFDEDRVWSTFLKDWWIISVFIVGLAAWITATVTMIRGDIYKTVSYNPVLVRDATKLWGQFERSLVFSVLPTLLFAPFNATFTYSDHYHRTMRPVENMIREEPATAEESVLMDYRSSLIFWVIGDAARRRYYRLVLLAVLALLCWSSQVVVGRIFTLQVTEDEDYLMVLSPRNFYAAYGILTLYLPLIWVARPRGVTRTCRPLYTLHDLLMMCHQSYILRCPEFWAQEERDTFEHLRAQVTLADRRYRFGVYTGFDGREHLGISITDTPQTWFQRPNASDEEVVDSLEDALALARYPLSFGLYDPETTREAAQVVMRRRTVNMRVRLNRAPSTWQNRANWLQGQVRRARRGLGNVALAPTDADPETAMQELTKMADEMTEILLPGTPLD